MKFLRITLKPSKSRLQKLVLSLPKGRGFKRKFSVKLRSDYTYYQLNNVTTNFDNIFLGNDISSNSNQPKPLPRLHSEKIINSPF